MKKYNPITINLEDGYKIEINKSSLNKFYLYVDDGGDGGSVFMSKKEIKILIEELKNIIK